MDELEDLPKQEGSKACDEKDFCDNSTTQECQDVTAQGQDNSCPEKQTENSQINTNSETKEDSSNGEGETDCNKYNNNDGESKYERNGSKRESVLSESINEGKKQKQHRPKQHQSPQLPKEHDLFETEHAKGEGIPGQESGQACDRHNVLMPGTTTKPSYAQATKSNIPHKSLQQTTTKVWNTS